MTPSGFMMKMLLHQVKYYHYNFTGRQEIDIVKEERETVVNILKYSNLCIKRVCFLIHSMSGSAIIISIIYNEN